MWFMYLLEHQSPLLNDFETFAKEFCATFGNSNKDNTSTSKLDHFAKDFAQQLCMHSNSYTWHAIFRGMKPHS
jgi:hypothetical protein